MNEDLQVRKQHVRTAKLSASAFLIRRADAEHDARACAEIYAPHITAGIASFEEEPPSADEMAARIRRYQATHAWLVAERNGEVVGYAYATPHRERAAYRWSIEVSVYVASPHTRRGVGRALYEELLARMRARGFRMALAGITLPNEASVALHEGLGFRPVGVFRNVGWKQDGWRDVGWWELDLSAGSDEPPPEL